MWKNQKTGVDDWLPRYRNRWFGNQIAQISPVVVFRRAGDIFGLFQRVFPPRLSWRNVFLIVCDSFLPDVPQKISSVVLRNNIRDNLDAGNHWKEPGISWTHVLQRVCDILDTGTSWRRKMLAKNVEAGTGSGQRRPAAAFRHCSEREINIFRGIKTCTLYFFTCWHSSWSPPVLWGPSHIWGKRRNCDFIVSWSRERLELSDSFCLDFPADIL